MSKDVITVESLPEGWELVSDDVGSLGLKYQKEEVVIVARAKIVNSLANSVHDIVDSLLEAGTQTEILEVVKSSTILNSDKWYQVSIVYGNSPRFHLISFLPRQGYYLFLELVSDLAYARTIMLEQTKELIRLLSFSRASSVHSFKGRDCYYNVKLPKKFGIVMQPSESYVMLKGPNLTIAYKEYDQSPVALVNSWVDESCWGLLKNNIQYVTCGITEDYKLAFATYRVNRKKDVLYVCFLETTVKGVLACIQSAEPIEPNKTQYLLDVQKAGDDLHA